MAALRIGYTCHDRFPSTDTNTQQIFWTLYEVARLGHTVDLRVRALERREDIRETIARHYGAPGSLPDTLRISADRHVHRDERLDTAWFDLVAPRRFSAGQHDVVWTRDPLALVSAMRSGVPAVFETFRPDFAKAAAFAPWRWATVAGARSRASHSRLLGVIAHSQLTASAFAGAGVPSERCLTAHNGQAPSLMEPVLSRSDARLKVGLPADGPLLVYTGHVGPQKGTESLIDLARALPEATVVIVGVDERSAERAWIGQQLAAADVHNVLLVPRVSVPQVAPYLYAADCLIIPPTDEPLKEYGRTVLPMKVFSYMAAGRPILAPALPDIEEVLLDGQTALLVRPGDTAASAQAVRRILADPRLAARLSDAARTQAQDCTWEARARVITTAVASWLERPRNSG